METACLCYNNIIIERVLKPVACCGCRLIQPVKANLINDCKTNSGDFVIRVSDL